PFRERVDGRDADAVEAGGDRVDLVVELAARVDVREGDLEGALPRLVAPRGDAAAVVGDGRAAVGVDAELGGRGDACHRLVYRVVHDLEDEVGQAARARVPDVHGGARARRL